MRAFAQDVRKLLADRQRVVIISGQARRIAEVFGDEAILGHNGTVMVSPATDLPQAPEPGTLALVHGRFPEGWHSRSLALSVFTDAEIFGWSKRHGEQRRAAGTPATFLAELRPGDFIVHQDHGIGRFEGLVKLSTGGVEREYLLIQYAGTDKLYIPTDQLDRITRYIGMGDAAPALSKLGGSEWIKAKQRAKESVTDIARDLLRLYTVREVAVGHPFPSDEEQPWLQELEESFPYEETPDQLRAIEEVKADMERAPPDGPPRLRRRRLRQDRGGPARRLQGRARPAPGGRARAHHRAGPSALQHLHRAPQALPRPRRTTEPLPLRERAEGGAGRRRRRQGRHRRRHASPALQRCRLPQSGPADHRRGAALRRRA